MKTAFMRKRGEEVVISFDYDRKLVDAIKSLLRRRFDAYTKEWVVPIHLLLAATTALEVAGAEVRMEDDLRAMLEGGTVPVPEKPEVTVGRCGHDYIVQFEYDPSLVRIVKGFPGRSFDPAARAWFVPIEDEGKTLRNLLDAFRAAGATVRLEPKLKPLVTM